MFTDGSKDKKSGGAAFFDPSLTTFMKLKIDSDISIMHIELIAIAEALSYIQSINSDSVVILTDSKSALQHLARHTSHGRGVTCKFSYLMKKTQSPNCIDCGVVDDLYHILMECVRNENTRINIFGPNKKYDIGYCNSILASPLSSEAIQLSQKNEVLIFL